MEQTKNIGWITFLLAMVAGYCDTVTFVAGDAIFSAHVTGNFIVFAAQVMLGGDSDAYVKLLTFPVFVLAVIAGGQIMARSAKANMLLKLETALLLVTGIIAFVIQYSHLAERKTWTYFVVMLVVIVMGLQNAYGKLFAKETFGPTTMMTGNVTQLSLDLGRLLMNSVSDEQTRASAGKQAVLISGFLAGCLAGAIIGKTIGLTAIALAGLLMVVVIILDGKR